MRSAVRRLLLFPVALLLLLQIPTYNARPINYFDATHTRLALGDPPGLDPPPGPGSGWIENSDVHTLTFQHWDAAVLRTFFRRGETTQRTFVALVAMDGNETAYLDLGEGYLEFNRPHMTAGST